VYGTFVPLLKNKGPYDRSYPHLSNVEDGQVKNFASTISKILIVFGLIFVFAGLTILLIPMNPENIHLTVNGVPRDATNDDVKNFKLAFFITFTIVGSVFFAFGLWRSKKKETKR
jgi:uncharacterized membrane protein YphA (DoxX/SURF4 family)